MSVPSKDSDPAATPRQRREARTQGERTAEMRQRVNQATLAALSRVGYERLSFKVVAEEAGVSRGAITHHFPTKSDLLVGSFEQMIANLHEVRLRFRASSGSTGLEQLLRFLWREVFNRPGFVAAIELMLAARADPELQRRLGALLSGWLDIRDVLTEDIVGSHVGDIPLSDYMQMTASLMRGTAVYGSFSQDPRRDDAIIERWIKLSVTLLQPPRPGPPDGSP